MNPRIRSEWCGAMCKTYLGKLAEKDPLHDYLLNTIQPQVQGYAAKAKYRVFKLNGSNDVFLYEDKYTGMKVVGKFFLSSRKRDAKKAAAHLTSEFENLTRMRDYGMTGYPHTIVRPLGRNYAMNALLITENCDGELLSEAILTTIHGGDQDRLYNRLTTLAHFLSVFHNRTAIGEAVDFNQDCTYLDSLIRQLSRIGANRDEATRELCWFRDQWRNQSRMWEDQQVLVHGDATPENFIFGGGKSVIGLDLERAKRADRVFDIGRIAGELKHFFMRWTGNRDNAEPFIGHFLWEYACHFPDRERTFRSITRRIPFYMGMTLLRISRNDWVDNVYRRELLHEARLCLGSF